VCFGLPEKPLRISITVIHLVLNVEFKIDMLPRLRKTGPESAFHFDGAELAKTVSVIVGEGIDAKASGFVYTTSFIEF